MSITAGIHIIEPAPDIRVEGGRVGPTLIVADGPDTRAFRVAITVIGTRADRLNLAASLRAAAEAVATWSDPLEAEQLVRVAS